MNNTQNGGDAYRAPDYMTVQSPAPRPAAPAAQPVAQAEVFTPDYSASTLSRLQEQTDEALLTDDEARLKKKLMRRRTRRYFSMAGIMMIIFTLILSFTAVDISKIAMCVAVPEAVSESVSQSGLSGIGDFYYNEYSVEGGKYYATYGLTENISYCVMVVIYCLVFAIFMWCNHLGKTVFTKGKRFSAGFFFLAFIIGVGLLNLWAEGYSIAAESVKAVDLGYIFEAFEQQSSAAFASVGGTIFYFLATCIFAPIGEEFVCRGVLLSYLRKYGDWFAILISAMLFGLMHANFYQGPYAFVMGVMFGYVTVKTGSIGCSILMHMLNNTISTVCEISAEFAPTLGNIVNYLFTGIYIAAIPASIVLLIIFAAKGKIKLDKPEVLTPELATKAKGLKFCLSWPNLLFILFCLLSSVLLILPSYTALMG